MKMEDEILVNKYGQDLTSIQVIIDGFAKFNVEDKRLFLKDLIHLIIQSKPQESDISLAIEESKLKPTYTPCVLLKGVSNNILQKVAELPAAEQTKALVLLMALFKIAYKRRFELEKGSPTKWWYRDLSTM